jgi:thiamine biosynthesis lipoprotein
MKTPSFLKGLVWLLVPVWVLSCSPKAEIYKVAKPLMGTVVEISVVCDDARHASGAIQAAFNEMARLEAMMSVFRDDSELSRLNREGSSRPVRVSPELFEVIEMSLALSRTTRGAFDITVGPLMQLWPFYAREKRLPSSHEIQEVLRRVGYAHVILSPEERTASFAVPGMALDLGGIAKGYAIDRAVAVLKEHGIAAALVNAGGDVFAYGEKPGNQPWRVGLRHPRNPQELLAALPLANKAVVTSGDYERYFLVDGKRYSHIIDPRSGVTAQKTASVTVVASSAAYADGLATGILVLGAQEGLALVESLPGVQAAVVTEGEQDELALRLSKGFREAYPLDERHLAAQRVRLVN